RGIAAFGGGHAFDLLFRRGGVILGESRAQQRERKRRTGEKERKLHCEIHSKVLAIKTNSENLLLGSRRLSSRVEKRCTRADHENRNAALGLVSKWAAVDRRQGMAAGCREGGMR